jgi:palmitoyltransferase
MISLDDQQVEDDEDPDTKAKVEDKSIELANIETVETGKMSLRRQGSTQVDIIDQANKLEKRYCSDCYVDQPIRSKHCKDCGFCIATYDHHCIWVGNCIGERNRPLFMAYLLIQSAELFICIGRPLMIIQEIGILKSATTYPILVTLVISYFILTLTLISLLGYHVYFMFSNMTTWEYISWSNITYLEGFEKKDGSPFSISPTHNFILYMKPSPSTFYDWVPFKSKNR